MKALLLIPAYKPAPEFVVLLNSLKQGGIENILVVDDGSGESYREIFDQAAKINGVEIIRHAVNLGKGAALRSGMNAALLKYPGLLGIVTADADGQHHPEDVKKVCESFENNPQKLILGSRQFSSQIPLRSSLGNVLTRFIFFLVAGLKLRDTQTGLRAIPSTLMSDLLRLKSSGYEFELEMLLKAARLKTSFLEVPIKTIYEDGNKSSHFNPVFDSLKIYFVFVRFVSTSLLTQIIDTSFFSLLIWSGVGLVPSQLLGRVSGGIVNFSLNKDHVFKSQNNRIREAAKFAFLVLLMMVFSYGLIRIQQVRFGIPVVWAKIMAEGTLFFFSFAAQRLYVFGVRRDDD